MPDSDHLPPEADWYEMHHVVGFEETNLVGNVYYVNLIRWQGRCRELFLRDHCPELLEDLGRDLVLVTTRCACEFLAELEAFDEIAIRMRLGAIRQNRVEMLFDYVRLAKARPGSVGVGDELVARGEQEIACMRRRGDHTEPIPLPASLRRALEAYGG